MALVLTRRRGEEIKLTLAPDYTQADLEALVTDGIALAVTNTESNQVKLAFEAPDAVDIYRTELLEQD